MLGNMLYVIFTIIVQMCSARLCNECHVTYVPAFDDIVLSDNQLWSRVAPSREVCYRLCFMDQKCVTFQHNSVSEICRGHDGSFTSQVISQGTADTGNKLYMTCRGDSHLGFGCKSDSDCRSLLNECIDGVCQCSSGFDYNNKTLSCGYHGCFRDDSSRLLPHELTHSDIMTNKFCIDHCLAAGYRLSGTEVGKQCFCGNTIPTSYEMYSESRCSSSCSGDTTKRCGGVWAISIYSTGV